MTSQSDDEKAVRAKLVAMGVGPNGGHTPPQGAPPPPPLPKPPKPQKPPRVIPRPRPKPNNPKPLKAQRKPRAQRARSKAQPGPTSQHPAWTPAPRQSLIDAWTRVPPRVKWLAYHLTAAGVGWRLGWVRWASDAAAWYAAGDWTSPSAWVLYGLAILLVGLYRRTRHWAWPVAWVTAIPVSSVVVGLLLYGTDYTNLRLPW